MTARAAVLIVVTLSVFGLIAAVGLPVAVDAFAGNTSKTLTQDVNTDYDVNGELVSNVTAATAGTPDTAAVELNDTRTSGTTSNTIDNGSTETYDLDGGEVVVGVEDVEAGSNATVNYTYSNDYAYSSGASALWNILGLAIVLGAFLYVVRIGVQATNQI